MASIYIYNRAIRKCVKLSLPQMGQEDLEGLRGSLPTNLQGISFDSPFESEEEKSGTDFRVEKREGQIAQYLKSIGEKLERLNQEAGALRFYDLAFRLSPNSDIVMRKAKLLTEKGHPDKAQRLLDHYLENQPSDPKAYYRLGRLALNQKDYQRAHQNFFKAKKSLRPNNVEHKSLKEVLDIYARFVEIFLDRDGLFQYSRQECQDKIQDLSRRTINLIQDIELSTKSELKGMLFFLENQKQTFKQWLIEMATFSESQG